MGKLEFKCQSCGAKIIVVNDPSCCFYKPMFCLGCSKKMQGVLPSAIANRVFEHYIDVESKEIEQAQLVNKSDREIGGDQK